MYILPFLYPPFCQKLVDTFKSKKMSILSEWNNFTKWLAKEQLFVNRDAKGKAVRDHTHLLLNGFHGGKLNVPDYMGEKLLEMVMQCSIVLREQLFVVEMPTLGGFKLYCELDLVFDTYALTAMDVRQHILPPLQSALRDLYPDVPVDDFLVAVCMAPAKTVKSKNPEEKSGVKSGIHLIWPYIIVTRDIAWKIRGAFLTRLVTTKMPDEWGKPQDSWDDIIDSSVFDKNGLRMIWSHKAPFCPACKGERRFKAAAAIKDDKDGSMIPVCDVCFNVGRIDDSRSYEMVDLYTLPGNEEHDEVERHKYLSDYMLQVKLVSIRVLDDVPKVKVPVISDLMEKAISPFIKRGRGRGGVAPVKRKFNVLDDDLPELQKRSSSRTLEPNADLEPVEFSDPAYAAICKYAEEVLNAPPVCLKRNKHYHIYILATRSHTCLNKGGDHESSCVYYTFKVEGIVQRCWAQKCAGYKSDVIPYDEDRKKDLLCAMFKPSHINKAPKKTESPQQSPSLKSMVSQISMSTSSPPGDPSSPNPSQAPMRTSLEDRIAMLDKLTKAKLQEIATSKLVPKTGKANKQRV